MDYKKSLNPDQSTRRIIVKNNSGSYSSYTPKEAAQMINLLRKALWSGVQLKQKRKL